MTLFDSSGHRESVPTEHVSGVIVFDVKSEYMLFLFNNLTQICLLCIRKRYQLSFHTARVVIGHPAHRTWCPEGWPSGLHFSSRQYAYHMTWNFIPSSIRTYYSQFGSSMTTPDVPATERDTELTVARDPEVSK